MEGHGHSPPQRTAYEMPRECLRFQENDYVRIIYRGSKKEEKNTWVPLAQYLVDFFLALLTGMIYWGEVMKKRNWATHYKTILLR